MKGRSSMARNNSTFQSFDKLRRFFPFIQNSTSWKKQTVVSVLLLFLPFFIWAQSPYAQAVHYFEKENFDRAAPIFEDHLNKNPSDAKTREYLGDIASHKKDWDKAIAHYGLLVKEHPLHADYRFKYGAAMGMKAVSGSRFRAVSYVWDIKRELEMAAQLDPKHIETRWALIEYYLQLPGIFGGSEKKALDHAVELSKISKVDGYLAKGHIAEFSNRYKDAELNYKKAIEVGGSPHTYEKLIKLYEKNKKPLKAIETASKSLKLHNRNRLNYQIGKICAEFKLKPKYGIQSLSEYLANYSLEDEVPKEWAFYRLAQLYKNLGQKEIALTWINKALSGDFDFKEAQQEKHLILAL